MEFWIELVMKYKEILISIRKIKKQRENFINNFQTDKTYVYESLVNAIGNDHLNSIRVHIPKYNGRSNVENNLL